MKKIVTPDVLICMFQLTDNEADFMVSQNATPSRTHLVGTLPYVFTEQGFVRKETWAMNSDTMIESEICEFENVADIFIARFARPPDAAQEKSSGKSSGKTGDRILSLIAAKPEITIPELSGHLGVTTRAIEKQIAKLQLCNRLRRVGPDKGGHWEVSR